MTVIAVNNSAIPMKERAIKQGILMHRNGTEALKSSDPSCFLKTHTLGSVIAMLCKLQQTTDALWQYLNQPILGGYCPSVWQFRRFWYLYKIQHLENCLSQDIGSQRHYSS